MKSMKHPSRLTKSHGAVVEGSLGNQQVFNADWHLPSGKSLAEFALEGGYLAPLLISTANFPPAKQATKREGKRF